MNYGTKSSSSKLSSHQEYSQPLITSNSMNSPINMKKEIKNRELTPELFRSIVRDDSIEMSMCTFERTDNMYTNRSRMEISQTSKYIENQNQSRIPLSQSNPSHLTNTHLIHPSTNINTSTSTYNPIQSLPLTPTKSKLFLTKSENQNQLLTHSYQTDSLNVSNSGNSVQGPSLGLSTSTWIEDQYLLSDRAIMAALARTQMDIEKNRKNNLNSSYLNSSSCNNSNRNNDGNNGRNNEIGEINDHNIYEKLGNKSKRKLFFQLFIVSTVLWTAWLASTSVQQTSRRLANIAFISLVLALSFTLILFISIVDSVGDLVLVHKGCKLKNKSNKINNTNNNTSNNTNNNTNSYDINNNVNGSVICDEGSNIYNDSNHDNRNKDRDSLNNEDVNDESNDDLRKTSNKSVSVTHVPVRTLEYLNTMQLPVFLIANVFTGMINMSIETMYVTHLYAFFILLFYLFTVVGVSWYLISRSKNN